MDTSNSINGAQSASSSSSVKSLSDNSNLGKDEFLKLFVAQLAHQDPMEPLSNDQFIAQMATFSQLEQITNLNGNFSSFMKSQEFSQSLSLIGKEVTALSGQSGELITGKVSAVSVDANNTLLTINGEKIPAANVKEIKNSTN